MNTDTDAAATEVSSTEYSTIWVAYVLQATGAFGFMLGPLIGLVINYARRDAEDAGFIASHHRWLIRTFWWTLAGYLVSLAVILAGLWPVLGELIREALRSGGHLREFTLSIDWKSLFATVGAAALGGLSMACVWVWNLYRIMRGGFLLADRKAAP
jgi:uncharacterized membrane protein